ncbi:MAG: putative sulfate exporter family transporter [Bacillota bacterium]|nr:putative sulfate exporter family transporter [Bacillota bacterium]
MKDLVESKTAKKGFAVDWSPLWKTEDWWTVWLAALIILASIFKLIGKIPAPGGWSGNPLEAFSTSTGWHFLLLFCGLALITFFAAAVMKQKAKEYLLGFPFLFALSLLAFLLGKQAIFAKYQLDNVIWALIIGLIISNTAGRPKWLSETTRTELFIKTGLVLLGAEILFNRIMTLGTYGLGVAWLVTPIVFITMLLLGIKVFKIPSKSLVATISAATSVCGVSAAIAAGSATRAKKEEISYAISISLIFTVLMMIGLPYLIKLAGLGEIVGGALIGGTVDSTGAVVVAGSMLGERAMEVAAVIKMIQNVLIGIIAFFLSLYWVTRVERKALDKKPSILEIWNRFPKFILGFVLASAIFSFVLIPYLGAEEVDAVLKSTKGLRGWFFCLAFVSIGLETNFRKLLELGKGGKPVYLYIVGQLFNIALTLLAALIFFGGRFFPAVF